MGEYTPSIGIILVGRFSSHHNAATVRQRDIIISVAILLLPQSTFAVFLNGRKRFDSCHKLSLVTMVNTEHESPGMVKTPQPHSHRFSPMFTAPPPPRPSFFDDERVSVSRSPVDSLRLPGLKTDRLAQPHDRSSFRLQPRRGETHIDDLIFR